MFPDQDAGLGVAATLRAGLELEEVLAELDGIVVGHGAFIGEAADVVEDLLGGERTIHRVRIGRGVSKARMVAREEAGQDRVGVVEGARAGAAELAAQAIVDGAPEAFDPAFGLGGGRGDPADAHLAEGAADVGERALVAAQLQIEGQRLAGIALEDAVAIGVEGDRTAGVTEQLAQHPQIAVGVFLLAEEGRGHVVRGVVDRAMEDERGPAAFEPVVMAGIELHQQARLACADGGGDGGGADGCGGWAAPRHEASGGPWAGRRAAPAPQPAAR